MREWEREREKKVVVVGDGGAVEAWIQHFKSEICRLHWVWLLSVYNLDIK